MIPRGSIPCQRASGAPARAPSRREPLLCGLRLPRVVSRSNERSLRTAFDALYEAHAPRVLAYALRRTTALGDAEDVVAETFSVAWRRFTDIPDDPAALPWLLAVARRVIANQRRSAARRLRLVDRLHSLGRPRGDLLRTEGGPALAALARLSADDQELLRLVAWDDLSHAEIAATLEISVNAVAIRLHRARGRFRAALARERSVAVDPAAATTGRGSASDTAVKGSGPRRTFLSWKGRSSGDATREPRP